MKEKALAFIKANRGGLVFLAITMAVTLLTALVSGLCGAEYTTLTITAMCAGTSSAVLVSALFKAANLNAPMGNEWGVLGVIVGTVLTMIIY